MSALALLTSAVAHAQWREFEPYRREFLTIGDYSDITAITATTNFAYFAAADGVLRWDIINERWIEPLDYAFGFFGREVRRLAVTFDDEKLWAETDQGVFLYERIFGSWDPVSDFPVAELKGELVAPEHLHIPPDDYSYLPDGLLLDFYGRRYQTGPILRDNSGYLWMGIEGLGPARSEINGAPLELLPFGLLDRFVEALAELDGRLVIGGRQESPGRSGLTLLDPQTGAFEYIEQGVDRDFPVTDILSLAETDDELLVGSVEGLFVLDKNTYRVVDEYNRFSGLPHSQVNALIGFGDTVFAGTQSGLAIISPDSSGAREIVGHALSFRAVYCLEPAYPSAERRVTLGPRVRPRYVWVGAESGAYRLDVSNFSLKKLNDPEFILNSPVHEIRLVGGNLWLLAEDGLVRVELKTGVVESYPEFNNAGPDATLAVNNSLVAVGDSRGLAIFQYREDPGAAEDHAPLTFRFSVIDGLPSNFITSLEFIGDFLWIGSDQGLCRFWWSDPSRIY
ncbi:MAG TPA: hypothetical protein VLB27_08865 [candidate division Zixibacteria bacterium]|nr:hypothetical protein [candidate division Zixibacteria bacterium]